MVTVYDMPSGMTFFNFFIFLVSFDIPYPLAVVEVCMPGFGEGELRVLVAVLELPRHDLRSPAGVDFL